MLGSIGLPELIIVGVIFLIGLVWIWPAWRIVGKTGHPGPMALLFLIPLVNLGMLFYFALSEWPIEKELKSLKRQP